MEFSKEAHYRSMWFDPVIKKRATRRSKGGSVIRLPSSDGRWGKCIACDSKKDERAMDNREPIEPTRTAGGQRSKQGMHRALAVLRLRVACADALKSIREP